MFLSCVVKFTTLVGSCQGLRLIADWLFIRNQSGENYAGTIIGASEHRSS
jgi:hypothetical protein